MLRAIGVIPMLSAALILRTDRRIVRQLRRAGATSAERAVGLRVPSAVGGWRLRRLTAAGALGEAASGRYILREEGYGDYRKQRQRRGPLTLGALIVLVAVAWAWQNL